MISSLLPHFPPLLPLPRCSHWHGEVAWRTGFTAHWFLVDWIKSQGGGTVRGAARVDNKKKKKNYNTLYVSFTLNYGTSFMRSYSTAERFRRKSGTMSDKHMHANNAVSEVCACEQKRACMFEWN